MRKEEEARQRAEKELQERKAREEAERARKENEDRLRREEEERQERRKRVEAIMARTRGKTGSSATANNKSGTNGNDLINNATTDQSNADGTAGVGVMMTTSMSQPDLLGDIVNKANGSVDEGSSKNGFHEDSASVNNSTSHSASNAGDLLMPDMVSSVVIANNADNANNIAADEHVTLLA